MKTILKQKMFMLCQLAMSKAIDYEYIRALSVIQDYCKKDDCPLYCLKYPYIHVSSGGNNYIIQMIVEAIEKRNSNFWNDNDIEQEFLKLKMNIAESFVKERKDYKELVCEYKDHMKELYPELDDKEITSRVYYQLISEREEMERQEVEILNKLEQELSEDSVSKIENGDIFLILKILKLTI